MHGHIHKELLFHLESKMTGSVWQFEWQQDINVELSMSKLGLCQIVVSLCHFYSSFRSQHKNYYQFTMFLNSSFLFHPFSVDINIVGESVQIQPGQKHNLFIADILARKWVRCRCAWKLDVVLVLLIFASLSLSHEALSSRSLTDVNSHCQATGTGTWDLGLGTGIGDWGLGIGD